MPRLGAFPECKLTPPIRLHPARTDTISLGEIRSENPVSFSTPERLPGGFTMTKLVGGGQAAVFCQVWTNPFGWEVRLLMDEDGFPMTTVARSVAEMLQTIEQWRGVLAAKGWM